MSKFRLKSRQRRRLRESLKTAPDARVYQRSLALLQMAQGRSIAPLARELRVSRQTLYNWRARYEQAPGRRALGDSPRSGRPTAWTEEWQAWLQATLEESPEPWGYAGGRWTVPLLQEQLGHLGGPRGSEETLRRQLHLLGYSWKRCRYVLEPDPERTKKNAEFDVGSSS